MSAATDAAATTTPRSPALARDVAMRLAREEYTRFVEQLRELSADEWPRPTACSKWDVHAMACHVLGMAELAASPLEQVRQMRAARRTRGLFIDALTDLQVRKHVRRSPTDIVTALDAAGAKAARGRARVPALLRRRVMGEQPVDDTGSHTEPWTVGFLVDVILTRDTWMHRSDIALATGRTMALSAEHDGALVADVAAEWAQRHAQPCTLALTGPAGGTWAWGAGGPSYELDAVEFCRTLSGRGHGEGLLATRVPF